MNQYDPKKHHRRSIRLKGYDYSEEGMYFVTICVRNKKCLFGEIIDKKMILNDAGKMVEKEWLAVPARFPNVRLHEYMVMPNHFHSILEIVGGTPSLPNIHESGRGNPLWLPSHAPTNTGQRQPQPDVGNDETGALMGKGQPQGFAPTVPTNEKQKRLGDMVGAFQSITTVEYIRGVKNHGWERFDKKLWQRNYWEHIIRNETAYRYISNYIIENPEKWDEDRFCR